MNLRLIAVFLLAALAGVIFPPYKTVASQKQTILPKVIQITSSVNEQVTPVRVPIQPTQNQPKPKAARQPQQSYEGRIYTSEEVQTLIIQYSNEYQTSPEIPLRIARCESGFNQMAANKSSSAKGVYQWLSASWRNQPASIGGKISVLDADANIKAAVSLIAHGNTQPWDASRRCWNK